MTEFITGFLVGVGVTLITVGVYQIWALNLYRRL